MANNQGIEPQTENIPDSDELYRCIHISYLIQENTPKGDIPRGSFIDNDNTGISTDWCKYSTPSETLNRKDPKENGVIGINVRAIRTIKPLIVKHTPKRDNIAHTSIFGFYGLPRSKKQKIRLFLMRASTWRINPPI
ncbi:MAG: hypothetical protein ACTSPY_18070 [Candidatus Helarchaeota archaeon]